MDAAVSIVGVGSDANAGLATAPVGGAYEPQIHRVQGEILDRELANWRMLADEAEHIISLFEGIAVHLDAKSPALRAYSDQVRGVRRQIEEMRENERRVSTDALPVSVPAGGEDGPLLENARKAAANHAYFGLFSMYQVLLENIHRLLGKVAQIDRALAPQIAPVLAALVDSWRKLSPLGGALTVRRVTFDQSAPIPDHVRQAWVIWKELLRRNPNNSYLQSLAPHASNPGTTRIVFISVGGLGDALLQTPCVAELKRRFEPCEILFIHSRPVVHPLFARNPSVAATVFADEQFILRLPDAVKLLGLFDVAFESRFIIWGELCHGTRLTSENDIEWVARTQQVAKGFAPYLERFPHYGNLFARLVRPKMVLDVHGLSTGLPVTVDSPLVLSPDEADAGCVQQLGLAHNGYVTVHDGFDESFARQAKITRCTKQLPAEKWRTLITGLRRAGFRVVQVGSAAESALPGIDLDLRGKTSISQLCFVLKGAAVHIDTEGGIVHVARAVHKRSIVFFGPTSVSFWGYPQNINLRSAEYTDHWWVNSDWMARSPIAQECSAMDAMDVSQVPAFAVHEREVAAARSFQADVVPCGNEDSVQATSSEHELIRRSVGVCTAPGVRRVAVVGRAADGLFAALAGLVNLDVFVLDEKERAAIGTTSSTTFGSAYNLPANSGSYDVVICAHAVADARFPQAVVSELLRVLAPGAALVCRITPAAMARWNVGAKPASSLGAALRALSCETPGVSPDAECSVSGSHPGDTILVIRRNRQQTRL